MSESTVDDVVSAAGDGIRGRGIVKTFKARGNVLAGSTVQALRGVDFHIPPGGAASFIGESGCGKTTLGRILAGLEDYDAGTLSVNGVDLTSLSRRKRDPYFRRIQMIHQDPYSALNPTRTVDAILTDPLTLRARQTGRPKSWIAKRQREVLSLVGLEPDYVLSRYPHQLSGGMRQRVVIARALTVDPEALVADEAVSMIDVSLRLGILRLLRELRETVGVSVLFITHDVATARYIGADGDLYVIYRGQIIERGPTETIIANPVHPYTQCLLSAIPVLHGLEVPGADRLTPTEPLADTQSDAGCLFAARCPFATDRCRTERPDLAHHGDPEQLHACFYPEQRRVVAVSA
ncbi:ABC transporter ATP-binding protein [Actinocatenispora comari]|uniref:ABC transporter ATP-binding protein n=1 Tax=Actinocatenispora comari TaxID=2807577 RepID=A0A8J4A592_9ACTN|nr:ABC transporter ATP-binding protein [Actinocatenispora comari]GIL25301.1 ABC transporter ATP-binding protein [Actinocatenispora comari]